MTTAVDGLLFFSGQLHGQFADYWIEPITELGIELISSSKFDEALIDKFLAYCSDSNWWTQTIAFTAVYGRRVLAKAQHRL